MAASATVPVSAPVDVELSATRPAEAERWRSAPVACSLTSGELAERADQWRTTLAGATRETIPDGVRLTLPAERIGLLATLAAAEQQCCPFFDFRLHPDGPVAHLEARAPADATGLLDQLFAPTA